MIRILLMWVLDIFIRDDGFASDSTGMQIIWPGNPLPLNEIPTNVEKQPEMHKIITHDNLYWLQEPDAVQKEVQSGKRVHMKV